MDLSTDLQAEVVHITCHSILDQISETITITPEIMTTDRDTTETTIETDHTNKTPDMTRGIRTNRTGLKTLRTDRGLTTEDDLINTNTTEINLKHKSHSNSQTETY